MIIINVTFDCECGGSVDEHVDITDWFKSAKADHDHYEQISCDACGADYDLLIEKRSGNLNVHADGIFNLAWEFYDGEQELKTIDDLLLQMDEMVDELSWVIKSTDQLDTFEKTMRDVVELINAGIKIPNMSTLYNMAYTQVVTTVEAYLSGVFIHKVVNSKELMRKLVESNPDLAKKQFSLKEIFSRWEGLQLEVAGYLHELIFHNLEKVKPMYKSVLGIDLGEIPWLFKAVQLRHDCVHRNGVDKKGNRTGIDKDAVESLIKQCASLLARLDQEVAAIPTAYDAPGQIVKG